MSVLSEQREEPATGKVPGPDGRALRRERNVAAARSATLDLISEGRQPSLGEIADRAGVATRSVYRYFGDAETAISDAVSHRAERAREVFLSEPEIAPTMPFDERLAMLILRRLRLDRLVEPLANCEPRVAHVDCIGDSYHQVLDAEVRAAFEPELTARPGDTELGEVLCAVFRLRSVNSMRKAFADSDEATASALSRIVLSVLDGDVRSHTR